MAAPRNAVMTNRGREYVWKDERFRSVTSILGKGIPKPALVYWAAKSVAEYVAEDFSRLSALHDPKNLAPFIDLCKGSPWRQRDKAADVGTKLHEAAEAHTLGKPITALDDEVQPYLDAFIEWIEREQVEIEAAEFTVYSRQHHFAGTADAIALIDGKRWLIDYKTSAKGPFPDNGLQLAAYAGGEFIGMPDGSEVPVPKVDAAGVLKVRPEGAVLYPVRADAEMFRFFLYAAQIAQFVDEVSKDVIGPPESERALKVAS